MKEGLLELNAYQVASIRILSAGIILLPFTITALNKIEKKKIKLIIWSGLLGSFFPAYLFCIAETKIDSALAGILNSLTPLFTIIIGVLFFRLEVKKQKYIGVMMGFIGLVLLLFAKGHISFQSISFSFLILIATIFYGVNVNLISTQMKEVGSLHIASVAFCFLIIPSILILYFTGYFKLSFISSSSILYSTVASVILGIFGTAFASILFYVLVKRAGGIFASLVTYGIPFVAIIWGIFYGEVVTLKEVGCLVIILLGVFIVNKKASLKNKTS